MSAGRKAEAVVKAVSAMFPKAFGQRQPLKYKIHEDLLSAGVEHKVAAAALSSHRNSPRYLMSMVEGATRIDLQGQPAGMVTAEEAARAQQQAEAQGRTSGFAEGTTAASPKSQGRAIYDAFPQGQERGQQGGGRGSPAQAFLEARSRPEAHGD